MITAELAHKAPLKSSIHFGTDGWRGVIAEDFTFENLRRVAAATADYILQGTPGPVVVGFDRRFLSREFATCAAQILQQRGLSVVLSAHPLSTPAISVCVVARKAVLGVMITASHNPPLYNGFKLKEASGRSAPESMTRAIEQHLLASSHAPSSTESSQAIRTFEPRPPYQAYLQRALRLPLLRKTRQTVVFDHLYGAASGVPERLLARSALRMISLHSEPDPLFGGLHPEPIDCNRLALKREVRRSRASVGLAFDGDADRLGVVDDRGHYLTPHQVFPLLALYGIEHKKWRGKIVQSVSLGMLGERIAQAYHLPFEEVPVGFKHIAERMLAGDVAAGGEESGGYGFQGGLPERDGILSGLLFLEMIAATGQKPSHLLRRMEKQFGAARYKRCDIALRTPLKDKSSFVQGLVNRLPDKVLGSTILRLRQDDGLKIRLADGAWLLLRPSGTEPLMRTYAESDSWEKTGRLLALAKQWLSQADLS